MSYDAGALLFKIQTVGQQIFQKDQADAKNAVEKTGKAAATAGTQLDTLGKSTDETGKKSKAAKAPLTEQAKATEEVGEQSRKAKPKQDEQAKSTEAQAESAKKLSFALLAAGTAVAAMVSLSVVKSAEFDSAMSNVRAATMATVEDQNALGEAALEAGADTAYSASEAAAAEEELAKAGLSVAEIVGGSLNGALALAAAGQLNVARSAEIMATTLKQYNLEGKDASHVSDLLAAGAGKAQGSVDDLAQALQYVGPVAAGLGISVEETTGALALFASQGQIGERAGTGLRGVLMSLTSPSALAAKTMKEYNVEIFDSNGKMKSLAAVSQQLQDAFSGLTEEERSAALGRIFGNEQITAARVLYSGGAAAVNEWTDAVDDSGYAAEQAAMRQDNLAGDIEKLGGAFDTALIRTGTNANDVLRSMTQGLTELVDMYGEAPEPIQATAMILGVATAAMLLFAGGAVGARAKFLELKAQLDATNASMGRTAIVGGLVGIALTGVIAIVGGLMAAQAEARQKAESYADALEQGADAARSLAADALTAEKSFLWLSRGSAADAAEKLGLSLDLVADAATGNADALEEVNAAIEKAFGPATTKAAKDLTEQENEAAAAAQELRGYIDEETAAYENGTKKLEQKNEVTEESVVTSESAADAYLAEADSVEDLNSELAKLIDQINAANGVNQDAISANAEYRAALEGITGEVQQQKDAYEEANGSLDGFNLSLDENTAAGSANADSLSGVAQAAQEAAEKQYALDQQTMTGTDAADKYAATLAEQRTAFEESAVAAGYNADEVKALADRVFDLPSEKDIQIVAETQQAHERIAVLRQALAAVQSVSVILGAAGFANADGNVIEAYANGGIRENHVAQMARGGAVRVWAEPETGGETYIPHAVSKRPRSEQLMAETASILGGTYIPAGSRGFADGAVVGTGGGTPEIRVVVQSKGGIDLLQYIDVKVEQGSNKLTNALRGG